MWAGRPPSSGSTTSTASTASYSSLTPQIRHGLRRQELSCTEWIRTQPSNRCRTYWCSTSAMSKTKGWHWKSWFKKWTSRRYHRTGSSTSKSVPQWQAWVSGRVWLQWSRFSTDRQPRPQAPRQEQTWQWIKKRRTGRVWMPPNHIWSSQMLFSKAPRKGSSPSNKKSNRNKKGRWNLRNNNCELVCKPIKRKCNKTYRPTRIRWNLFTIKKFWFYKDFLEVSIVRCRFLVASTLSPFDFGYFDHLSQM